VHRRARHEAPSDAPAPRRPRHGCDQCEATFTKKSSLLRHHEHAHGNTAGDSTGADHEAPVRDTSPRDARVHSSTARMTTVTDSASRPRRRSTDNRAARTDRGVRSHTPADCGKLGHTRVGRGVLDHTRADGSKPGRTSASSDEPAARQYHCPHCELTFPRLATLSRHVRSHFGISEDDDQ